MMKVVAVVSLLHCAAGVKLAFIGDSNDDSSAERVYQVLRAQGADHVIQNGDFDYNDRPWKWSEFLDRNWFDHGKSDVIMTAGNHDTKKWGGSSGYQALLYATMTSNMRSKCTGRPGRSMQNEYGLWMSCKLEEVHMVLFGWNEMEDPDRVAGFVDDAFAASTQKYRVCVWHRPEGKLNNGHRHTSNYGQWAAYEACRRHGAFVVSGHSHCYGRTKVMSSYTSLSVGSSEKNQVSLGCGESFSVVSGMAGKGPDDNGKYSQANYWAKGYTTADGDDHGALVCDFPTDRQRSATCGFYTTASSSGRLHDSFTLESTCASSPPPPPPTTPPSTAPSTPPTPPSSGEYTISAAVQDGGDDVEEHTDGRVSDSSSDLEFSYDKKTHQVIGVRWTSVEIPPGAVIVDARIAFKCDERGSGSPLLHIAFDNDSDSNEWSSSDRPTTRSLYPATEWQPTAWDVGQVYSTPDLSASLQQVVSKFDWTSRNAISVVITSESPATDLRVAESYNKHGQGPVLNVRYTIGGGGPPTPSGPPDVQKVTLQISRNEDDVEEKGGSLSDSSSDLELAYDVNGGNQMVGLRFTDVGIPNGAEIVSAYLEFTSDETDSGSSPSLVIWGDRVDSSQEWLDRSPSRRSKTRATVSWTDLTSWSAGGVYSSPDISSIITEITSRSGWSSSSALSIMIASSSSRSTQHRVADSHDGSSSKAPRLVIEYA